MAPGVAKSFVKEFKKVLDIKYPECNYGESRVNEQEHLTNEGVYQALKKYRKNHRLIMNEKGYGFVKHLMLNKYSKALDLQEVESLIKMTETLVEDDVHQAMEAVIHNLNSMHSRAGKVTACPNHGKPWVMAV